MGGIWAVLRHTFAHCLRMKVGVAFIILLVVILVVLPLVVKGDGTLAGKIKTFLATGSSLTALLLSAVTIFLSILVVTSDVQHKQIFIVASKPIARWQYVLGRWAGVAVFDAVLLVVAGGAMYAFSQYLRTQPALNTKDRRMVETEVFTARDSVHPIPPDIKSQAEQRIARLKEEGRYSRAIEAYQMQTGGDQARAEELLLTQIRNEVGAELQSVGVGRSFFWRLEGIRLAKEGDVQGSGEVTDMNLPAGLMRIRTSPRLLGRMVYDGPVKVNGVNAKVFALADQFFDAYFFPEDASLPTITALKTASKVSLTVDPTIQITYQAYPVTAPPDKVLRSIWQAQNPTTGLFYQEPRSDTARTPSTLTLSARLVDDKGRIDVSYVNMPFDASGAGTTVTILNSDIAVLYRVGGFEGNLARAMALIFLQVMFLAGVGVFCGTFLSFPVACLVTLAVLPLGMAMGFLTMATTLSPIEANPVMKQIGGAAVWAIKLLLPDLSKTSPTDYLVGGTDIGWGFLARTAALTIGLRVLVVLAGACVIFSRRELARVQV